MIELLMGWLAPAIAILGALGVTGIYAYGKGRERVQKAADEALSAERQKHAEERLEAKKAAAQEQVKSAVEAMNVQQAVNKLDDNAIASRLRANWTRPD
jgi:hypothetical protein